MMEDIARLVKHGDALFAECEQHLAEIARLRVALGDALNKYPPREPTPEMLEVNKYAVGATVRQMWIAMHDIATERVRITDHGAITKEE